MGKDWINNRIMIYLKREQRVITVTSALLVAGLIFFIGCSGSFTQVAVETTSQSGVAEDVPSVDPKLDTKEDELVLYRGAVENIFFHPLIVYPELAFDNDRLSKGYNDWFITVPEFKKILEALNRNNFILVGINDVYEESWQNGKKILRQRELLLPKNRKPLIISIDDLNYYEYMIENGNVHKLILDAKRKIATFSILPDGKEIIAYDNEIIPILDEFVERHPDFSFRGAKGIIALTGYQGVLGYRTNDPGLPDYEKQKNEVLAVIKRLKEAGWSFASHGYGHLDTRERKYNTLVRDTLRWKNEVEPLVGPTSIYVYPFGSSVLPGDAKFQYLLDAGFNVFYSVGPVSYFKFTPDYLMMDRRRVDGLALQHQSSRLLDLFDSNKVIDNARLLVVHEGSR